MGFEAQGGDAVAIYRAMPTPGAGGIGGSLDGVLGSEDEGGCRAAGDTPWLGRRPQVLPGHQTAAMIQLAVGGGGIVLALIVGNIFIALGIFGIGLFIGILLYGVGYIALMAAGILGLVEGIVYLTKSDEEFQTIYVTGKKEWL